MERSEGLKNFHAMLKQTAGTVNACNTQRSGTLSNVRAGKRLKNYYNKILIPWVLSSMPKRTKNSKSGFIFTSKLKF
jgi:hypothetical protein